MVESDRRTIEKRKLVNELHKPARKNFKRRRVIMKGIDDLWQADLVEMGTYAATNNGYRFLLTIIDTFSKYAWAIPIKSKTGDNVTDAMITVLNSGRIPKNIQSDDGTEFFNTKFQLLMKKHNINHYSTFSSLKASIVERFNRTLKNSMWKEFSMNGTYKWIDIIQKLVATYNKNYHQTIKMSPIHVNYKNEEKLLSTVYNNIKVAGSAKFKIHDYVRISKYKHLFEKGYTPNWTTEIFQINKIQSTNPVTYLLRDFEKNPIEGAFYELELAKVADSNLYLVENIVQSRGSKVLVKWLGFPAKHNSWVNKNDVL